MPKQVVILHLYDNVARLCTMKHEILALVQESGCNRTAVTCITSVTFPGGIM